MRLAELLGTLSLAVDASIGLPDSHALRSATLAVRLADIAGADAGTRQDSYYLALLALCGCTAEAATMADVTGDEIVWGEQTLGVDYGRPQEIMAALLRVMRKRHGPVAGVLAMGRVLGRVPKMAAVNRAHCEVGVHLAERFGFAESFRAALFQAFERWDGSGMPQRSRCDGIALSMRIVHVAIDVDIGYCLGGVEGAVAHTKKHARRGLDPELVERFQGKARDICAVLSAPSPWAAAMDSEPAPQRNVDSDAIDAGLRAIADYADLKSRFTLGHSPGVARRASAAAERLGLDRTTTQNLARAALIHDIGRVGVSGRIWDKREPLSDAERERIRLHTYIGERLLSRSPALEPIAAIATLAHERIDGSGYHRRLPASACSVSARVLAAADVLQALTENRPHRRAFTEEAAKAEVVALASNGKLCPEAVNAVVGAAPAGRDAARSDLLSEREADVLRLVARGLTNKEVANELAISPKTVGHHLQHVFEKLGVTTRAAASVIALQRGLVGDDAR